MTESTQDPSGGGKGPLAWKSIASSLSWNVRPFVGGNYFDSVALAHMERINPANETALYRTSVGHPKDIDRAVQTARQNFECGAWSRKHPAHRAEVLRRLADMIARRAAEFAILDCLEMGKPVKAALHDAEVFAPMLLRSWADLADKVYGNVPPLITGMLTFNAYEPRGVVGAIAPWNFPLANAVYKCGPALAAGNTVVLKPSELAPSSALKLAEIAIEAGLPEGTLNVVPGLGTTVGSALALHPGVDMLSFTGSTSTGRRIMERAGQSNGKAVLLECGGKSPHVIFEDTQSIDRVAIAAAAGVLVNQGQVCSAHTRILVQRSCKEALLQKLVDILSSCQPGDPLLAETTFGPLASAGQRDRVKAYIQGALHDGARAVIQGVIQESNGCFVAPTLFDNVSSQMPIVADEIFGPVSCIQTFDTEEQAVALANETCYGLTASVWTSSLGRGMRMAQALRAGSVTVRTGGHEEPDSGYILGREPRKASGFGSELGIEGLRSYSALKCISFRGS